MSQITDPAVLDAIAALDATSNAVKSHLVERDDVIDVALTSLVAETNIFLCGQPGIAKSAVFGDIFKRIENAKKGFYALTKASVPDMLVGPMSIKALTEEDRVRHHTTDMLPEVHLAFIDEVFKGNALTRNHILTILNERVFYNGGQIQDCPLLMAAAASNEYPDTHEDAAFWDRFIVRMQVERIGSRENRRKMIRAGLARGRRFIEGDATLSLAQLQVLHEARKQVVIPDLVFEKMDEILVLLDNNDLDAAIGDRRVMESFHLVAASALRDGRLEATIDDLYVLAHTLWGVPDTRRDIQKIVHRQINPHMETLADMLDAITADYEAFLLFAAGCTAHEQIKDKIAKHFEFSMATNIQISNMSNVVSEMAKAGRDTTSARDMLGRARFMLDDANNVAIINKTPLDNNIDEQVA